MNGITKVQADAVAATRAEIVHLGKAAVVVLPPNAEDEAPSTALVKMGGDGLVKWTATTVRLSEAAGHIYEMPAGKGRKTTNITAAGYDHINRALGVSFFMPETLAGEDDAGKRRNPQVDRDAHGAIKRVVIRCIGFGRNAVGNWMAVDSTLYYDLEPCLAQDVLKKWRGWDRSANRPGAGADWGQMLSSENVPEAIRKDPAKKCVPIPGGYVLACKLQGEMLDVINEHAHRVRFATRNAETIVRRNVLKRFVGRQKLDASLTVNVVSWQQVDREHVAEIARLIDEVKGGSFKLDGEPVNLDQETTTVQTPDDEAAALRGDPEDGAHIIDQDAEPSAPDAPHPFDPAKVETAVATKEEAQAAVGAGTVSGETIEARLRVKKLWAELGGDDSLTDTGSAAPECWNALTGCGFENLEEALKTPDPSWLGQLAGALEAIQLKRANAEAKEKTRRQRNAKAKEQPGTRPEAPKATDGGALAMGDTPPAGKLFNPAKRKGSMDGDPG